MNPKLSIVIVTYNSAAQIGQLLTSIANSKGNFTKEVIIVDNGSQDKTLSVIRQHKSRPTVVPSTNVGFSKSVNQAIKKSSGDFILLLNPDTQLIGNCLQTLLDFAQKTSPLGAVAPRLLNSNGKPQSSVSKLPTIANAIRHDFLGCQRCFGKYLPDQAIERVEVAVMAAFLIPRSTIESIGLLDEKFFLYYEDVDYCRRLKQAGLPIYYLAAAKVKHIHGASGRFVSHLQSPLLASAELYYGKLYSRLLNTALWVGHKWQVILRGKRFRD